MHFVWYKNMAYKVFFSFFQCQQPCLTSSLSESYNVKNDLSQMDCLFFIWVHPKSIPVLISALEGVTTILLFVGCTYIGKKRKTFK